MPLGAEQAAVAGEDREEQHDQDASPPRRPVPAGASLAREAMTLVQPFVPRLPWRST